MKFKNWKLQQISTHLVTRKAGSLTTSGPTRTWPCSTNCVANLMESAILDRTMTIGNLLLQKQDAVTL